MMRILIIVLAMMMLISCVACSNNNQTDNTDPTSGSKLPPINNTTPGQNENPSGNNGNNDNNTDNNNTGTTPVLPTDLPVELRAPTIDRNYWLYTKKPFDANDPRKAYIENKYGVTAYLLEREGNPEFNNYSTHFALEGYEDCFTLYTKDQLSNAGDAAANITTDYVDTAWFAVMYPEIQTYFAKIVQDAGITAERVIVEYRFKWQMYDINQPFADALKAAPQSQTAFNVHIYVNPENDVTAEARTNVIFALDELNLRGRITCYQVLQDISELPTYRVLNHPECGKTMWYSDITN